MCKLIKYSIILYLCFIATNILGNTISSDKTQLITSYKEALVLVDTHPDSAQHIFTALLDDFLDLNDSTQAIKCLLGLSDISKNIGDYSSSYDYAWEALIMSEEQMDLRLKAETHQMLGMLFGIFSNGEQTIYHFKQSLKINKELIQKAELKEEDIIPNYFSLAVQYRQSKSYSTALAYLDTCLVIANKYKRNISYIEAEKAYIFIQQNQLNEAETLLNKVLPYFVNNDLHYQVIIYLSLGELKTQQNQISEAIRYYKTALDKMEMYHSHSDMKPRALEALSELYLSQKNSDLAYSYLSEAKNINDSLFSALENSDLLEVKNRHREAIKIKNERLIKQEQMLNEEKEANFRLKLFLALFLLFVVIAILLARNVYQRKKHIEKQNQLAIKVEHEQEKHSEIMRVKNKEITSYTLQLIDKERVVDDLLLELKALLDAKDYRRMKNRTKDVNKNLWKEFNERFTKVNAQFYKELLKKHPNLTPTDLKHCALIKLNFNGKEMAQLLNISLQSVHLARHRLRKKLGLERNVNLGQFIAGI